MNTYFRDQNNKSNIKSKKDKFLNTILKSIETFDISAITSISITTSGAGIGLAVMLISTGIACGLKFVNKAKNGIVMQNNGKHKKQNQ